MKNISQPVVNKAMEFIRRNCDQSLLELADQQNKLWKKRKKLFENTEVFKMLDLEKINSYDDYVQKVPVTNYESYSKMIEKAEAGEKNILHKGKPSFFGMTSGTTGNSKNIPYNKECIKMFSRAQTFTGGALSSTSKINVLTAERFSFGACPICKTENGFSFGYISGYLNSITPYALRRKLFPSDEALAEPNWDKKIQMILDESLSHDIEIITGVPTFIMNLMERILESTGKRTINEIWPNLKAMVYGAFPVNNYKDRINELMGHELDFYGLYAATEAPIGLPYGPTKDTQLYTFTPNLLLSFSPCSSVTTRIGVEKLEAGKDYFLRVGMPNGFLNYDLKDVIRIHSVSPVVCFEVIGRQNSGMNITAEKVSEKQLLDTVVDVKSSLFSEIAHYFVSPSLNGNKPCYKWTLFIENVNECQTTLSMKLDNALKKISGTYKICREEGVLDMPLVNVLQTKIINQYFDKYKSKGQFKMKTTFKEEFDYNLFIDELLTLSPS